MNLRNLLRDSGPWPHNVRPEAIEARLHPRWKGVRVFMKQPACKRIWRRERRDPAGAAERLAADIEAAVLVEGGDEYHVRGVLVGCMGSYLNV